MITVIAMLLSSGCDIARVDEDESTPGYAFNAFFSHIGRGEYDEAHALLSADFQDNVFPTADELAAAVEDGEVPVYHNMYFMRSHVNETEATLTRQASTRMRPARRWCTRAKWTWRLKAGNEKRLVLRLGRMGRMSFTLPEIPIP